MSPDSRKRASAPAAAEAGDERARATGESALTAAADETNLGDAGSLAAFEKWCVDRGFVLHAAVHEEYPEVMAMCHAHTTYGTAWCATGRPLDMISQDAAAFYNSHAVIGASAGAVAVEEGSGLSVAKQMGRNRGILHQNHGLLTSSQHSIDDAAFWFIALEVTSKRG